MCNQLIRKMLKKSKFYKILKSKGFNLDDKVFIDNDYCNIVLIKGKTII